jgi:hypothetical protein
MKPFLGVALTLLVSVGILYGYRHQQESKHLADGEIRCIGCMSPEEKASCDKRNAAAAAESERAMKSEDDKALPPPAPTAAQSTTDVETAQTPPPDTNLPDSVPHSTNSPSGTSSGGEGTYQWFREGSMTWRLNTKTGASCVALATAEEWQKPTVASHGCGHST